MLLSLAIKIITMLLFVIVCFMNYCRYYSKSHFLNICARRDARLLEMPARFLSICAHNGWFIAFSASFLPCINGKTLQEKRYVGRFQ